LKSIATIVQNRQLPLVPENLPVRLSRNFTRDAERFESLHGGRRGRHRLVQRFG